VIAAPWTESGDGILLTVRVTPKASRTALAGTISLPDGRAALAIRLAAPPVDGAANAALVRLIAATLGIPPSAVRLVAGAGGRVKRLEVDASMNRLVQARWPDLAL